MSLGYISTIALATGGPTNPVGIAVTISAGVVSVVSRFLKVGSGRDEADYLTNPETGAQSHAGVAIDEVTAQFWSQPESWTEEFVESTVEGLEKIGFDFERYASQFYRAGPGAVETIWYWINRAITDIRSVPRTSNPITATARLRTKENRSGLALLLIAGAVLLAK